MNHKAALLFIALILSFKTGEASESCEKQVDISSPTRGLLIDEKERLEKSLKDGKKRKRKEGNGSDPFPYKKKKENHTNEGKEKEKEPAISLAKIIEQPTTTSSVKQSDVFYTKFCEIMRKGPHPIQPIQNITVQDEDQEGSRRWVNCFDSNESKTHEWHKKQPSIIQAIQEINAANRYLPVETNFALAHLTFVLESSRTELRELPFFFISGWPANDHKNPISKFAQKLSEGKLDERLKDYAHYGLRFITLSYQGREEPTPLKDRKYDGFSDELKKVIERELADKDKLISEGRLKTHANILSDEQNSILAKLYFHSEQSIWFLVKEEVNKFKKSLLRKKLKIDPLQYVILDICSYYDMCWCCGDTLGSCAHTLHTIDKLTKIVIRTSGCKAYFDTPFASKRYSLREHRKEFPGFAEGKSYEIEPYKPYISHATVEDLQ